MGFLLAGERKNPFKGRWHSGLQAPNYRAEQRLGRREKTSQNNSFTKSLFFAVKSKGLQPLVVVPVATCGCIATTGWVPIATRGCIATAGWIQLQPIDALQLPVVFRLQPVDALQPPVVFRLQPVDALQPPVVFRLQPIDALQPWVVFGKEKKGWSNHPFSFSTSVFAPANAVMCAGLHLVTQPPDAPRRAVSPGRSPRSRVQGVPARFNGGDGVLRGFRGRNRNLPLIP